MVRDLEAELKRFDDFMDSPFGKSLRRLDRMLVPYWGEYNDYGFQHTFVYDVIEMCCGDCTTPVKAVAYILGTLCNYDMIICKQGYDNMPRLEERTINDFKCDPDQDEDVKKIWRQLRKCARLAKVA